MVISNAGSDWLIPVSGSECPNMENAPAKYHRFNRSVKLIPVNKASLLLLIGSILFYKRNT